MSDGPHEDADRADRAPRADDPFAETAGAYVLGALADAERVAFEAHLAACPACRDAVDDVAHLPALLAAVPAGGLADPPPSVLSGLLDEVARDELGRRRAERRRRVLTGGGLLGAAATGFVAGALVLGQSSGPGSGDAGPDDAARGDGTATTVALEATTAVPISATVDLEPVDWGTRLSVTCAYDAAAVDPYGGQVPGTVEYALVVRDAEGNAQQVATWVAVPGHEVTVPAATALDLAEIAGVEMTSGGTVVLSAEV